LDRGDSFVAFCGDTTFAFPVIFQIQSALEIFEPSRDRSEDITKLLPRIVDLINAYRAAWKDVDPLVIAQENATTRFLFGGWSWKYRKFYIYPIQYNSKINLFQAYTHKGIVKRLELSKDEKCIAIGNYTPEFYEALKKTIKKHRLRTLNYEPLQVLSGMLRTPKFTDRQSDESLYRPADKVGVIGGAPQALKIYQHANFRPIAIRWAAGAAESEVSLFGRPLLHYERTILPIYDCQNQKYLYPLANISN
jgi:hypothetical protein